MLATFVPLIITFCGAVASATLGVRAREEMIKVAAICTTLLFVFLSLVFSPLLLKVLVILVPSLFLSLNGSEG